MSLPIELLIGLWPPQSPLRCVGSLFGHHGNASDISEACLDEWRHCGSLTWHWCLKQARMKIMFELPRAPYASGFTTSSLITESVTSWLVILYVVSDEINTLFNVDVFTSIWYPDFQRISALWNEHIWVKLSCHVSLDVVDYEWAILLAASQHWSHSAQQAVVLQWCHDCIIIHSGD